MVPIIRYHRLTRANTPDRVSFRCFLPFSPWRAPAHLRFKKQKSLENPFLSGAGSFAGAEMRPDKERPAENTYRIVKGLDAVWAHFCPSKPCLPLSSDGKTVSSKNAHPQCAADGRSSLSIKWFTTFLTVCFVCALMLSVEMHPRKSGQMPPFQGAEIEKQADGTGDHL